MKAVGGFRVRMVAVRSIRTVFRRRVGFVGSLPTLGLSAEAVVKLCNVQCATTTAGMPEREGSHSPGKFYNPLLGKPLFRPADLKNCENR